MRNVRALQGPFFFGRWGAATACCFLATAISAGTWTDSYAGFDYEDLATLIEGEAVVSIAELLGKLPDALLSNYTLAYGSRSLHGSSEEHPRAILFGQDARLILAFNGDPAHAGYKHLEILQYRDASREWEARRISFARGVHLSEANPPLCLRCHGRKPRPLWNSYRYADQDAVHWPGFYGSTHDAPLMVEKERTAFEKFQTMRGSHPRYRHLKVQGGRWFPYGRGAYRHSLRPNNRLGNLLARLQARTIAARIREGAFFRSARATGLLWLLGCPQARSEKYLDAVAGRFRETFPPATFEALFRELAQIDRENRAAFMLEKLLTGLETYTWNLNARTLPDGERFSTGIVSIDELVAAQLLAEIAPDDSQLARWYVTRTNRALYDSFKKGYYRAQVAPGGVGAIYDSLGPYYDVARMQGGCTELAKQANDELDSAL